jgi:hypothetical protein
MPRIGLGIDIARRGAGISWQAYWRTRILAMNPVFFIEDLTVVDGDGNLIDISGNDKKIAVTSATSMGNDTVTMPASDADIIAALTAGGLYKMFYTNDSTPIARVIGAYQDNASSTMFSDYHHKNWILLPSPPSYDDLVALYGYLNISLAYLPDVNILKLFNYYDTYNPNTIITSAAYSTLVLNDRTGEKLPVYSDNVLDLSVSKKTITKTIGTADSLDQLWGNQFLSLSGGIFTMTFWIDRTNLGDRRVIIYVNADQGMRVPFEITATNLATQGYTYNDDDYTATNTVVAVSGNWSFCRMVITKIQNNGVITTLSTNHTGDFKLFIGYGTQVNDKAIGFTDVSFYKDTPNTIINGTLGDGSYDKTGSNIVGKSICTIGDSITLGGSYAIFMQYKYGLTTVYNCGQSGRRMVDGANSLYQDRVTVVAQPADIFIILASANDSNSPIGTVDSTDGSTYAGGYNNYLTYLLANKPAGSDVILCTHPVVVGGGNTLAQGETAYSAQFTNMANMVKALGVKHSLPVCDLHSLTGVDYTNANLFLSDGIHWNVNMNQVVSDVLGKFISDLYA